MGASSEERIKGLAQDTLWAVSLLRLRAVQLISAMESDWSHKTEVHRTDFSSSADVHWTVDCIDRVSLR